MQNDHRAETRERRSAWFIAVVMLAATIYLVSQGGLLSGLLGSEDAVTVDAPPDRTGQYRRAVTLSLHFMEKDAAERRRGFEQMRGYGINWVEIPLPVWKATSRNLEYSSFELDAVQALVRQCREHDLGTTLLPLYWNGDTLSATPEGDVAPALLQSYRIFALDLAALAASSHADAILLDALFGAPGVSASEWLSLLEDLRSTYHGAIDARMDEGSTPLLYLRHLDGAYIAPDTLRLAALRVESLEAAVYLRNPLRDRNIKTVLPWKPFLEGLHYDPDTIMQILDMAENNRVSGFTLTGLWAFTNVIVDGTPLGKLLRSHRERSLKRQLEQRRQVVSPGGE